MSSFCVTCIAPSNIATIKYWGKRDESLILPINDSISVTLSAALMRAKTTVCASPKFKKTRFWLNGREESFTENPRLVNCLSEIQELARRQNRAEDVLQWKLHICSENNFPTAAGLASSAAGYACLVFAAAHLYGLSGDLTAIARRGSGSACRSLHGGFVQWHMGTLPDGTDSLATQIAPASHWPDLRILILIVRNEKKGTSSTSGMNRSVASSELLKHRVAHCVPHRIEKMRSAILEKDLPTLAELTMQDSNQFHAVCLDTYPPAVYMTDVSHDIASLVHAFNAACRTTKLAYSFDAGPNACLFMSRQDVPLVVSLFSYYFPQSNHDFKGEKVTLVQVPAEMKREIGKEPYPANLIKGMILSDVGDGPQVLGDDHHLLGSDGLPKQLSF